MWLKFTKMQGTGNDFIVIDAVTNKIKLSPSKIRALSDRRFGIGCDQLLIVEAPTEPDIDFNYRIFNSDGVEVEQCGNGARCFAKYVRDRKLNARNPVRVSTLGGKYELSAHPDNSYSVAMGAPVFELADIPFDARYASPIESNSGPLQQYHLSLAEQTFAASLVSMGNPHAVLEVADVDTAPVLDIGPQLETHPAFPNKANIGFMQIVSRSEIKLRVFERGAGETLACGTGACAAVVAGIASDKLDNQVEVQLPGGKLKINWPGEGQSVILSGSAKTVFHGRIRI